MTLAISLLVVSLAAILLAAELFTNGIEWFGHRLRLGEGAVGSILAAVGTALPETTIAIVAVIAGGQAHTDVGIGAILGAPMMLSTLAMFITGIAVLGFSASGRRSREVHVNYKILGRDLRTFFVVYLIALSAAFIPVRWGRICIGVFLLVTYAYYVRRTFTSSSKKTHEHELGPLHLQRKAPVPRLRMIIFQLLVALGFMVGGAKLFLNNVTYIAGVIKLSPLVLSVIITPIATELPEKLNSIIWIRQKKDTLALGNISGAMVFQSSITPAIGIFFTSWMLNPEAIASIIIAVAATSIIWAGMNLRKRLSPYSLLIGGLLYAAYPIYVFGFRH
ncbi:MAG: sodium:calcium antiporter [Armatimonadota bacterium]